MREWFEQELPLLLSHLYLPISDSAEFADWFPEGCRLRQFWDVNSAFILGDLNRSMMELFALDEDKTKSTTDAPKKKTKALKKKTYGHWPNEFKNLHRLLTGVETTEGSPAESSPQEG